MEINELVTSGGLISWTPNRSSAREARSSDVALSPVKTAQSTPGYASCTARTAHQSTRSPPPPSLVYGWKNPAAGRRVRRRRAAVTDIIRCASSKAGRVDSRDEKKINGDICCSAAIEGVADRERATDGGGC